MSPTRTRRPAAKAPRKDTAAELRRRLEEAEETLEAIRSGAVDAFVVRDGDNDRVYTLAAADRPYRLLVESMQEGALVLSSDGTILFANTRMSELLAVPRERLASNRLAEFVAPESRLALAALLTPPVPEDGRRNELVLVRGDGSPLPVLVSLSGLPLDRPILCAIVTDLTGRREFEELLHNQQAMHDLERRKDEFLAVLAHELRSPLAPLRNGLQIMQLAQRDPRMLESAHNMMKRQLQRMVRLIDDLIDISRITAGKLELQREPVAVADVFRATLDAVLPIMEENGHFFGPASPDETLFVNGDLGRLTQVFVALLGNASKFTARGGRVSMTAKRSGNDVVIVVRDTGAGIAPDLLPRIFDLFAQAEPGADRPQVGLGVGLSIARRLVDMHGGSIEARSEGPGKGSEFIVCLPLTGKPAAERRRGPSSVTVTGEHEQRGGTRRRVLVADDNVDSARSLAQLLTLSGYDVRTAYHGADAYELAEWFRPHVALLDLTMPNGDGTEICRRIRDQAWGRDMTIYAVTGWTQPSSGATDREAGFARVLMKPIEPAELLALLAESHAVTGETPAS